MNAVDRWITDCRVDLTADLGAIEDNLYLRSSVSANSLSQQPTPTISIRSSDA
jgi:hypothetical protein